MKQLTESQTLWLNRAKRWGPVAIMAVIFIVVLAFVSPQLLAYLLVALPLIGVAAYILANGLKWPPS